MSSFVHLHNHTHFSLLDGAIDIKRMLERAAELNMDTLAITDHGNMFGVLDFYLQARKYGIKPIIGMEAYIAPGSRFEKKSGGKGGGQAAFHLLLLAQNNTGYKNLMKLSSLAYLEGFYYRPRIDKEILRKYSEGIIASSACMKGEIFYKYHHYGKEHAIQAVEEYVDIFGDNFYLEIQNHDIPEEAGYEDIYRLAKDMSIPVIATNDVHYLRKEHHASHDVLLCVQSGKLLNDQNRMRYNTTELYLKSVDAMYKALPGKSDAMERTLEIAEKCNVEIETGKLLLPQFPLPPEFNSYSLDDYLKKVSYDGAKKIFGEVTPQLEERLEYELGVIKKTGYAGYFLIVKDFIDFARSQDIPVGLGRGSAAGSLVAYTTGITRVDPIRYDLLFERFLNPERVSMPDIDIDFCFERREEVIDYVRRKYGDSNVAQIITFGTMATKGVIRDVARVLGIEYSRADMISKLIPVHQGKPMHLEDALEKVPELKVMADEGEEQFLELVKHAKVLEGLARHASMHAAGIIIAPDDLTNYAPLYQTEEKGQKIITTQFTMTGCETIGLLKMDFLGLRTLTVLHKAIEMLREKDIDIDLDNLPLDDQDTYALFSEGNTVGIFQFESSGMQEYLRRLQPNRIEDLIAMNALYRPGPMENIGTYIERKFGREKIEYLHPKLEPILKETYGIIVYQEQVMRVASELGGFTLGKADILRRAMGKKKKQVMEELKVQFVDGCAANGINKKTAIEIYDLIFKFASYGFNKSHSAAYAILAYQTAYLKRHYPAEFMAATLTSEINDSSRIVVLIDECRKMGIEIQAPDVNRSGVFFQVPQSGTINFGLAAIKNVGQAAINSIIRDREELGPFKNIFHFLQSVDNRTVNKKILESLVQAGAMDSLEGTREQNFAVIETAIAFAQRYNAQSQNRSQISLFDIMNEESDEDGEIDFVTYPPLPDVPEWTIQEKLEREKELLGFYISGHPLDKYSAEIKMFSNLDWSHPETFAENREVRTAAIISQVKIHFDRKGNQMAFITLEDRFNSFEGVVFASVYEKYGVYVNKGEMVFVQGKASEPNENTFKMLCNEIIPIAQMRSRMSQGIQLIIDIKKVSEEDVEKLLGIIKHYPGSTSLYVEMRVNGNGNGQGNGHSAATGFVMRSRRYKVLVTDEFIESLHDLLGEKKVIIRN